MRAAAARRLLSAVVLAGAVSHAEAWAQSCDANHTLEWPAADPVWKVCWVSPQNSSGVDGSGIELTWASYQGRQVLARGHVPILNVKYDPGGCGGPDLSYRDWANALARFEADNEAFSGYAEPTVPPVTVCDHPGSDSGSFYGVAAEKRADRLILSTQLSAGWYRYIQAWTFHLDGRLEPSLRFTAVDNPCTPLPHYHNVYWRLDFDVDGPAQDLVEEYASGTWTALTTEAQRPRDPATGRKWRVGDTVTGGVWEIVPGPVDDVADAWAVADLWALAQHGSELDDGGATGGTNGDMAHLGSYVTGEAIESDDVVVWYRGGFRHDGPADCEVAGPSLVPLSPPGPLLSIGDVSVAEGNAGTTNATFRVTLSASSTDTVSVDWATADETAIAGSDYAAGSGTLTFPPGTTTGTVSVAVTGDAASEPNETFVVDLSGALGAAIVDGQGRATILNDEASPQAAAYDSALKAPKCTVVGTVCDSGPTLLNGRDGKGPEANQPNTINGSCADGAVGTYHFDESNDRLRVFTTDGSPLAAGKAVKVEATVWAWTTPSADKLDLYYAANANSPAWTLLTTLTPAAVGAQVLSTTYTLPAGGLQAVRARFRYGGSPAPCTAGSYDDHDDLVFAVEPPPPDDSNETAAFDATLRAPKCVAGSGSCDSGPNLLNGRDGRGPEVNPPNTINGSCADGTLGTYHFDESNDRLRVTTADGSPLATGKTVRVEATVWAWTTPSADKLDLYYAANANGPAWTFLTTLTPAAVGAQVLSATYTLPAGGLQAVRARFRYGGSPAPCTTGNYDDHDDLVFTVQ